MRLVSLIFKSLLSKAAPSPSNCETHKIFIKILDKFINAEYHRLEIINWKSLPA